MPETAPTGLDCIQVEERHCGELMPYSSKISAAALEKQTVTHVLSAQQ